MLFADGEPVMGTLAEWAEWWEMETFARYGLPDPGGQHGLTGAQIGALLTTRSG